ncbi:MAG: S-methyl-5'-thioadenosine phosphorylase [Dehalococcoidia bacterium]
MTRATLAVIGGSGFYEIDRLGEIERIDVDTPFGAPSGSIVLGTLHGVRIAFLPRHGAGHRIMPSEIPARANVWALASLGVRCVLSVSAVGSLKEAIAPLHMVVPDQLIDRTSGRPPTFFGRGIVAHISFDAPFCGALSGVLHDAAGVAGVTPHRGGTMVVIEGPAFSTRAESEMYRSWGADVIGMTALPEARLVREAGMCYATLACVTDYDTWHAVHERVSVEMIVANLQANVERAKTIVAAVARALPDPAACACRDALRDAIITPMHLVPDERKRELEPILARYTEAASR